MPRHLIGIEQLTKDQFLSFLSNARHFSEVLERDIKKVPALRGKTVINLFLEPSTRTRTSFEIAGKILSADTINISGSESSTSKGETLLDTAKTLEAMVPDILVMRHKESGSPNFLSRILTSTSIVNAGDGMHEHPTQALLDCFTLQQLYRKTGRSIEGGLTVAIVGDVRHSRVARSSIFAHVLLGNTVRLVGPETLVPRELLGKSAYGALGDGAVSIHRTLESGLKGADVVICLRMQLERQDDHFVPSLEEYSREFGVGEKQLARLAPSCVVMHPGPANRGIEVSSEVLDGPRSLFREQVRNGVAVRMAVLFELATGPEVSASSSVQAQG